MDILSDSEMLRYNRQIILKQFDFDGQEALKQSAVLILGDPANSPSIVMLPATQNRPNNKMINVR